MPKFEYATFFASDHYSASGAKPGIYVVLPDGSEKSYEGLGMLTAALNSLGADGWEFVGSVQVLQDTGNYLKLGVLKKTV